MIYLNRIIIIVFSSMAISCNDIANIKDKDQLPQNSKVTEVILIDSLGEITFSVPSRYDTSFSWVHYSDCGKPCDEQKYRLQPKRLPVTKETGWIWKDVLTDSIDRFTISHTRDFPFHDGDTTKNIIRHNQLREQFKVSNQNLSLIFDTIQKVNDRYYSIFVMGKSDTVYSKKVLAVTTIKSNEIKLQYELLTRKNDSLTINFIKNSIDLIKTIRFSMGQ